VLETRCEWKRGPGSPSASRQRRGDLTSSPLPRLPRAASTRHIRAPLPPPSPRRVAPHSTRDPAGQFSLAASVAVSGQPPSSEGQAAGAHAEVQATIIRCRALVQFLRSQFGDLVLSDFPWRCQRRVSDVSATRARPEPPANSRAGRGGLSSRLPLQRFFEHQSLYQDSNSIRIQFRSSSSSTRLFRRGRSDYLLSLSDKSRAIANIGPFAFHAEKHVIDQRAAMARSMTEAASCLIAPG